MGKRRTPIVSGGEPRTLRSETPTATLDLHGLGSEMAERRVFTFLDAAGRAHRGKVVKIVTGKGSRSDGPEVMREIVLDAITGDLSHLVGEWGIEVGGGGYLVRVRS